MAKIVKPQNQKNLTFSKDMENLITNYLANRKNDIAKIKTALDVNQYSFIQQISHGLKGSGGCYGLTMLSKIGETIERNSHKKDKSLIKQNIVQLETYLNNLKLSFK